METSLLWQRLYDQTMTTDEEKAKISKLLQGLEVPEVKLTEKCRDIVNLFHEKFDKEVDEEMRNRGDGDTGTYGENPYKVDKELLLENERKLRELRAIGKRAEKKFKESVISAAADPKRPWRTHTNKEKLLRIDNELKRHNEVASQAIAPMTVSDMRDLIKECQEETEHSAKISAERLKDTVEAAKINLPNFQYRKVDNGTATAIFSDAHNPQTTAKDTPKN